MNEEFKPITCKITSEDGKTLNCIMSDETTKNLIVELDGQTPSKAVLKFNKGSVVGISKFQINNETVLASSLGLEEAIEPIICRASKSLTNGTGILATTQNPYTVGSEYTCSLDTSRVFYVVEDNGDTITLIMDRNFTDGMVPMGMKWCLKGLSNTCNHNGLDNYINHIQELWDTVTVSIPSKDQIAHADGKSDSNYSYLNSTFLYDYLNYTYSTTHSIPISGYYTTNITGNYIVVVSSNASAPGDYVVTLTSSTNYGIRPIITVSKSQLSQ